MNGFLVNFPKLWKMIKYYSLVDSGASLVHFAVFPPNAPSRHHVQQKIHTSTRLCPRISFP